MIIEIKEIIKNYINNEKLCTYLVGSVKSDGIMINEKITIPLELIKGNLKEFVMAGDKVRILRNHGGKEFYIMEIINRPIIKGFTLVLSMDGRTYEYTVDDVKK